MHQICHIYFFSDHSFLFLQDTKDSANVLRKILIDYERASGQRVNVAESSIFFSKNLRPSRCMELVRNFGMNTSTGGGKYLGFPYLIGRSKAEIFSYLKDRLWKKLMDGRRNCYHVVERKY